jgi:GrpB-like predicted nucleotidyltransferase (UPF0157 family)
MLKVDWQKLNAQIMLRRELRKQVKKKEEELANLKIALKNMERDKLLKWGRRQKERIDGGV